jgi:hypothetical protein
MRAASAPAFAEASSTIRWSNLARFPRKLGPPRMDTFLRPLGISLLFTTQKDTWHLSVSTSKQGKETCRNVRKRVTYRVPFGCSNDKTGDHGSWCAQWYKEWQTLAWRSDLGPEDGRDGGRLLQLKLRDDLVWYLCLGRQARVVLLEGRLQHLNQGVGFRV